MSANHTNILDLAWDYRIQVFRPRVNALSYPYANPAVQELGKQNPELLAMINSNQQDFLRLIMEPQGGEEGMGMEEAMAGGGGGVVVELTPEDEAAIGRLVGLGFDRESCIEAYFACDKNEEMAANVLAENMFD